ncbi:SLATT domain-containing protein [Streptomyces sp. NPDC093568]|uniref:SLATT domain-containing protein n=1 Tax=Streptomyces sp. NPDC093568 TaxID=3366041 RepID=UPI00381D91F6
MAGGMGRLGLRPPLSRLSASEERPPFPVGAMPRMRHGDGVHTVTSCAPSGKKGRQGLDAHQTLDQWRRHVRILHVAHERAGASFESRGRVLGASSVTLSAVVGTAIFATIDKSPAVGLQILAGLLSVLAAVLAALHAFQNYAVVVEQHRRAALAYGRLRRRMDVELTDQSFANRDVLSRFASELDALRQEAPTVPQKIHDRAARQVDAVEGPPSGSGEASGS